MTAKPNTPAPTASQENLDQYNEDMEIYNYRLIRFAEVALAGMGNWQPNDPTRAAGESEPELTSKRTLDLRASWAFDQALAMMVEFDKRRKK